MKNKNTIIILLALAVAGGIYWFSNSNKTATLDLQNTLDNSRVASPSDSVSPPGKIAADIFEGELEEVNTGCYVDGECYVIVGGKHVTTTIGWSQDIVGSIQGVPSFGDLENHIGEQAEVYAQEKPDGTYTLYGSEGFYVKLKQ